MARKQLISDSRHVYGHTLVLAILAWYKMSLYKRQKNVASQATKKEDVRWHPLQSFLRRFYLCPNTFVPT